MYNICAFLGFLLITYIVVSLLAFIGFFIYTRRMEREDKMEQERLKSNILNGKEQ